MTPEELHTRMLQFGSKVIDFTGQIPQSYGLKHIGRQLIRASTSIGANYAEAQAAESKADFAHKLQIALKECRESHYWLKLLSICQAGGKQTLMQLLEESGQLGAILSSAVLTAKTRS